MIERVNLTSRQEWLADRLRFINASEIACVCGEASWGSLAELYAEKKGLRPPRLDNAAMRRGRWGESSVFEALAEERAEWDVTRARVHVRCLDRRLACTPDGFAAAPDRDGIGIVQAKVISRSVFRNKWLNDPTDNVAYGEATPPTEYRLQALTEVMLNELRWGILAVLVNGEYEWNLRLFDIERDEVTEARIEFNAARFWREHLDANVMPPFEPQRDAELVRALYPKDDGTEVDLTGDNRVLQLVEDWQQVKTALKRLDDTERGIKVELLGKIGAHSFARLADGHRLSCKLQHRKAHTVPAADFRVLRIVAAKHGED